jgi:Lipocalin-like domain
MERTPRLSSETNRCQARAAALGSTEFVKKTLNHSMFGSLFPNWLSQTQPRVVKIENDTIHLSTVSPIHSGGKLVNSHLQWKRAAKG